MKRKNNDENMSDKKQNNGILIKKKEVNKFPVQPYMYVMIIIIFYCPKLILLSV